MITWDKRARITAGCIGALLLAVLAIAILYQPQSKTDKIYVSALESYYKGDYQNAYYLFSKISLFSNLKVPAIYHRAECARMLRDEISEIKHYQLLFNNYPNHPLSIRARYLAGQKLINSKPKPAKDYFEYIIKNAPDTDYSVASEYYLGYLLKNKYKDEKIVPVSAKDEVQSYFRHYLKKAPYGTLALSAVFNWLEFTNDIQKDDYVLMANTCYLFGKYKKSLELLEKAGINENWTIAVKNYNKLNDIEKVKQLTELGLSAYSNYAGEDELIDVIDIYLSKSGSLDKLYSLSHGQGKDYIMSLKCAKESDKTSCYSKLYLQFPNGRFSADALSNIFFSKIKSKNYEDAIKIGRDHLNKFPESNSAPMVMFWLGKISEKTNDYEEYTNYYKNVITRYPDNYYAYRAYLRLKRLSNPLITNNLNVKPVLYPYKYSRRNLIIKLVELGDYDLVDELTGDDDFIRAWVLYKKGDYSRSMRIARNAMAELKDKPDKYDLRWRLVYPVIYYDEISKYANAAGNNLPLMMALTREESYFDPLAQSAVGASGLMQIMPSTASDINSKYNLGFIIPMALFNPSHNLELGNYYYKFLKEYLEGYDVSAVAAYNGGIGNVRTWKSSLQYNDTDEFVEQIPYSETKNYVKKVFGCYWNYIRIYSGNQ